MGYYNICTGGKITAFGSSIKGADGKWRPATRDDYHNDRGKTTELVDANGVEVNPTHKYQEPAYKRRDRERTQAARDYFGDNRNSESVIQHQLWKQIGGSYQGEFNATVERGLWQMDMERARTKDRTRDLSMELFSQIANAR